MDADPSEYANYWEIKCLLDAEELCSLGFDETLSGYCNSSSPDMAAHSALPNTIIMERERRKKLNRKLYNLRSVVPNMTKVKSTAAATAAVSLQLMHLILVFGVQTSKASIIFDAINYIQQLQEQERSLLKEISEQESHRKRVAPVDGQLCRAQAKKWRTAPRSSCSAELELPMMPSVEAMEVSVRELGNGISVIIITCSKKRHAMVRVCEVVESLDLRIVAASVASRSGMVFHTLMVDGGQSAHLKEKIEATFEHLMPREATASFREADPNITRPRTPLFYS
uniref:BHLH domain-containing protein n=1 Tax=Musa acuminata subsp. malaccensis TaxID=214687 RepID=A0A804KMV7_MUSAM